ncbi:MAG: hypothetical protein AB7O97_15180 [Planctomycetota bacterium]
MCTLSREWLLPVLSAVALGVAMGTAPAQQDPPPAVAADPLAAVAAAERALGAGEREHALLLLWSAESALRSATGAAAGAAKQALDTLLADADPLLAERREAAATAARKLVAAARGYRSRKWPDAARAVAERAAALDPDAAARELAQLGGPGPTSRATTAPAAAVDPIEALGCLTESGGWRVENGVLWSAPVGPTHSAVYITQTQHEDHRIAAQVDLGRRSAMVGVLIGCVDGDNYYICDHEVWAQNSVVEARLYRYAAGAAQPLQPLGHGRIEPGRPRTGPVQIEVLVRGDRVECLVDGARAYALECPTPVRGAVGFFVSGASALQEPLAIHDVEVTPLPEDAGAAPDLRDADRQRLQGEIADAIAAAEQHLTAGRDQQAALQLWSTRRTLRGLEDVPELQGSLRGAIDDLLRRADPQHKRRDKAFADAAALLRPLLDAYAAAAMPEAAARLAATVADLDPDTHTAALAEFTRRAAIARSERRGARLQRELDRQRQAEPPAGAAADDGALRAWFEGGRRPFHGEDRAWEFDAAGARTPMLHHSQAWILATQEPALTGARVQVQVPPESIAGIVFGWRSEASLSVAQAWWQDQKLNLRVLHLGPKGWTELGAAAYEVPAQELGSWQQLHVSWSTGEIVLRAGDRALRVPRSVDVQGPIGLMAHSRAGAPTQVQFRYFAPELVTTPPAGVGDTGDGGR